MTGLTELNVFAIAGRPLNSVGGAERSLARLCRALASRCTIDLVAPDAALPYQTARPLKTLTIHSYRQDTPEHDISRILEQLKLQGRRCDILYLGDKSCLKRPELLRTCKNIFPGSTVVLKETTAGKLLKVLNRLSPHDAEYCLNTIDRVVCISAHIQKIFSGVPGIKNRLSCIPNGIDTTLFSPPAPKEKQRCRQYLNLPEDQVIVLFAGRFAEKKNIDVIYGAWRDLEKRRPNPGLLVLLGHAHKYYDAGILRLIREDLRHARIVDPVFLDEDLASWYKASDFFLAPTSREGLSNAFLESAACGLYPIVTSLSGYDDVILNEESGMIVEERNTSDVIRCLDTILTNPDEYRRRGRTTLRNIICARYDIETVADRYIELFTTLSARK